MVSGRVRMTLPEDVMAFLREAETLRDSRLRINPLSIDQCVRRTEAFHEIPIAAELGLIVLDDADDSNPYCLITRGPAAGMVVHFRHEGDYGLHYPRLADFREALRAAREQRLSIDDLPRRRLDPHPDQPLLVGYLTSCLRRDDDDAPGLLQIHFPLLDAANLEVLQEAASSVDFLVREIAARFLEEHALPVHRDVATRLASDSYPQVADPARRALRAIALADDSGSKG